MDEDYGHRGQEEEKEEGRQGRQGGPRVRKQAVAGMIFATSESVWCSSF